MSWISSQTQKNSQRGSDPSGRPEGWAHRGGLGLGSDPGVHRLCRSTWMITDETHGGRPWPHITADPLQTGAPGRWCPGFALAAFRHRSRRCCRGWSRSAAMAGCPAGSSLSCGSDVPASVWSWHPTPSAAWSHPPLPPPPSPPLPPLRRLVFSAPRRRRTRGQTSSCSTWSRGVRHWPRCYWSRVCSTGCLQTGSGVGGVKTNKQTNPHKNRLRQEAELKRRSTQDLLSECS